MLRAERVSDTFGGGKNERLFVFFCCPYIIHQGQVMQAQLSPQAMRSMANSKFILAARGIYAARSDPDAPPPIGFSHALFDNLLPELQAVVAAYSPDEPFVAEPFGAYVDLTILPDISLVNGSLLNDVTREGANGNSLRALAMTYRPKLTLGLHVGPGMYDLMYELYVGDNSPRSHLSVWTEGQVQINVGMFHQSVNSLKITSTDNQGILLDSVLQRMTTYNRLNYNFNVTGSGDHLSSLTASSPTVLRRMMRRFVQTGLDVMDSNDSPSLSIRVSFRLPYGEDRDDDDTHHHLANRALQSRHINYERLSPTESKLGKPAVDFDPARTLIYSCQDNVASLTIMSF